MPKNINLKNIWNYLKVRKKYWLPPLIFTILIIFGILIFSGGALIEAFTYP